ncbi:glycosyltransferase [Fluviicola taffensis]|uniref:Glycosyl transferase group 1 n=1 Tax=Fluviicola taffensis (strain DSM 16823 / NCIMB 13979 / RW262) TaxID=755732 RepID=F2ICG3_FLUTR|nr:glycosyltransferase [Fluviicola taffensis]AEA45433.1 glycosyl transferase group 1 [Fluviicola taffensis DSM 16823]
MESKEDIIFIVSRFPYPLEKGDKLRAFYQLKELSKSFHVTLICTTDISVSAENLAIVNQFCKHVHIFNLKKSGLLIQLLASLFDSKPLQVHYFYRKSIHKQITAIIEKTNPKHIYCQLIRVTEYAKNQHIIPKTLDYMDALSKGMERRIQTEFWYKKWFYRLESKRLKHYERRIFDYFEHKTIISEQDRKLIYHPENQKIEVVPNGIDQSFFETLSVVKDYDIVFTGNFSYAPNIEAALYLAEEILPRLKQKGISCKLLLSGANPVKRVLDLQSESITVSGWVDDIRISYQRARLFVAPLFIGTGLQNKLLEAMASELPCITTPLANNALGGINNETILLAENSDLFVETIIKGLNPENSYSNIAKNGKEYIQQHFSWETQTSRLIEIIHSTVK